MWKMAIAFVVFAAVAMFVLMRAGDKVDMGGEKQGMEATHAPAEAASGAASAAPAKP